MGPVYMPHIMPGLSAPPSTERAKAAPQAPGGSQQNPALQRDLHHAAVRNGACTMACMAAALFALCLLGPAQTGPAPSQVFVSRLTAGVDAASASGEKLRLRSRARMATGDVVTLRAKAKVVLVSLKTGRRAEITGPGRAAVSADSWQAASGTVKDLPALDVSLLSRSFPKNARLRDKLGEVVRATESPIPVEVRRPMGAIPPGPVAIRLAGWTGVTSQIVRVKAGDREVYSGSAKRGENAFALPQGLIRPGQDYEWEVAVARASATNVVRSGFRLLTQEQVNGFRSMVGDSGLLKEGAVPDPDLASVVIEYALSLDMKGIALDILSVVESRNPEDPTIKEMKAQLIEELGAVG